MTIITAALVIFFSFTTIIYMILAIIFALGKSVGYDEGVAETERKYRER